MSEKFSLPYGANEIVALRRQGKRPADMILVSMVGPLRGESNPVVVANPSRDYDWRFLVGLDALLVVASSTDKTAVRRVAGKIASAIPNYLGVWFSDKKVGQHVSWGHYKPTAKATKKMYQHDCEKFAGIGA